MTALYSVVEPYQEALNSTHTTVENGAATFHFQDEFGETRVRINADSGRLIQVVGNSNEDGVEASGEIIAAPDAVAKLQADLLGRPATVFVDHPRPLLSAGRLRRAAASSHAGNPKRPGGAQVAGARRFPNAGTEFRFARK
jgi:hypothetical protein